MTPEEVHEKIRRMWPKSAAAGAEWYEQYRSVLVKYQGARLQQAWADWHHKPPHDLPPKPHELAEVCRRGAGAEEPSKTGAVDWDRVWQRHTELQDEFFERNPNLMAMAEAEGWSGDVRYEIYNQAHMAAQRDVKGLAYPVLRIDDGLVDIYRERVATRKAMKKGRGKTGALKPISNVNFESVPLPEGWAL